MNRAKQDDTKQLKSEWCNSYELEVVLFTDVKKRDLPWYICFAFSDIGTRLGKVAITFSKIKFFERKARAHAKHEHYYGDNNNATAGL